MTCAPLTGSEKRGLLHVMKFGALAVMNFGARVVMKFGALVVMKFGVVVMNFRFWCDMENDMDL